MLGPFFDKPQRILHWAEAKGFYGTPYDAIYAYFIKNNTTLRNGGTLYDYVYDTLQNRGYKGTIWDCLTSFFISTTGINGRIDAEKMFWDNSSFDFFNTSSYNYMYDDSGNIMYDDSGNPMIAG